MKISDLIIQLQEFKRDYGDLPVVVYDSTWPLQMPVTEVLFKEAYKIEKLRPKKIPTPRMAYRTNRILIL